MQLFLFSVVMGDMFDKMENSCSPVDVVHCFVDVQLLKSNPQSTLIGKLAPSCSKFGLREVW